MPLLEAHGVTRRNALCQKGVGGIVQKAAAACVTTARRRAQGIAIVVDIVASNWHENKHPGCCPTRGLTATLQACDPVNAADSERQEVGCWKRTVGPGEHAQIQVLELSGAQVKQVRRKAGRQQLGIQLACSVVKFAIL